MGPPIVAPTGRRRERPWWGLGDVALSLPVIIVTAIAGMFLGLPFLSSDELSSLVDGSSGGEVPIAILATSLLGQQVGQGLWPFVVSKWKGLGPVADWRMRFKPVDLALGVGTAIIAVGFAAAAGAAATALVGLDDDAEADNTQFLRDAEGSPWLYLLIALVVLGAPLAEEFFFRGLTLRAFEKRAGTVAAVVGSTLLFTLPHYTGSGWQGTVVLFASIGLVGAVLAIVTVVVDRIWPAVFAHMLFNGLGAAGALGAFGDLDQQQSGLIGLPWL